MKEKKKTVKQNNEMEMQCEPACMHALPRRTVRISDLGQCTAYMYNSWGNAP